MASSYFSYDRIHPHRVMGTRDVMIVSNFSAIVHPCHEALMTNQSWALSVFFNFFNYKNYIFCIFYQVNLTGVRLSK